MSLHLAKSTSGVHGFDVVARGGLPRSRMALLAGAAGTGKTLFACQFLAGGITLAEESGVFVAADRMPAEVRRYAQGLGLDLGPWEKDGRWTFVDATPEPGAETVFSGTCDLGALLARVEAVVTRVGARRLVIDSLSGLARQLPDGRLAPAEFERLAEGFAVMGLTSVLTVRDDCPGADAIADSLVTLRLGHAPEDWRRTIEITRFSGTPHHGGRFPMVVVPGEGLVVIAPRPHESHEAAVERIASGNPTLDKMLGGGLFRDSIGLVTGPPGGGKTLIVAEFLAGGAGSGDRCLAFSLHESRAHLIRHAAQWGIDFARMEHDRRLAIVGALPDSAGIEDHLHMIGALIERFEPQRVVIDSLSALDRLAGRRVCRQAMAHLFALVRERRIAALFTAVTANGDGPLAGIETDVAVAADAIIAVRLAESAGELQRTLAVVKFRGSWHERRGRICTIDANGLHIGRPLHGELEPHPSEPTEALASAAVFGGRFPGDF